MWQDEAKDEDDPVFVESGMESNVHIVSFVTDALLQLA